MKTALISHLNTSAFILFLFAKSSFLPRFTINYIEWIIKQLYWFIPSSVRTLVRSSVDLFIRPNPSVLLLVRSFRSFFRPFVSSSVRPFTIYPYLLVSSLSLFMWVRMSRMSNRTIGGHQSMGLLSREKLKTIHFLRKPTNNLITKLNKTCKK